MCFLMHQKLVLPPYKALKIISKDSGYTKIQKRTNIKLLERRIILWKNAFTFSFSVIESIFLAVPRGPCAGVDRAIDILEQALAKYGTPLYVNHDIVHNRFVVADFQKRGVIFSKNIPDIPKGSVYLFSAHGVSPSFRKEVKKRNLRVIDATCPLVTKVHREAEKYASENADLFFIGHRGHPEAEGTTGVSDMYFIETLTEAKAIDPKDFPLERTKYVLTQTTLSVDDTSKIISVLQKKFPNIRMPAGKDICYATTNRQFAVKKLTQKCDVILVVGSKYSSNSNRLVETAQKFGSKALLIDEFSDIPKDIFLSVKILGITSGASVPDFLVEKLIKNIQEKFSNVTVKTLYALRENVKFSLPEI